MVYQFNSILGGYIMKKIYVSNGNKKLKSTVKTRFWIFSIPAIITCPFRTAMCEKACYARKAERMYKNCLSSRQRNLAITMQDNFVELMIKFIEDKLFTKKGMEKWNIKRNKQIIFRIHESGDFYNQRYADDWLKIAKHFHDIGYNKIQFVAYTKSFEFFDGKELPANFTLLASIWDDTSERQREIVKRNGWKVYTAYDKETLEKLVIEKKVSLCKCVDCGKCLKCFYNNRHQIIAVAIH